MTLHVVHITDDDTSRMHMLRVYAPVKVVPQTQIVSELVNRYMKDDVLNEIRS